MLPRLLAASINSQVLNNNESVQIPEVDSSSIIDNILNIVFYIMGSLAVVMIIVGAIRFLTSNGDPGKNKQARMTIAYAVVGLIVVISAYAIVNWVLGRI